MQSNLTRMQKRTAGWIAGGTEQNPRGMIMYIRTLQTGEKVEGGLEKKSQIIVAWGKSK